MLMRNCNEMIIITIRNISSNAFKYILIGGKQRAID